jgi:hypothetical protein
MIKVCALCSWWSRAERSPFCLSPRTQQILEAAFQFLELEPLALHLRSLSFQLVQILFHDIKSVVSFRVATGMPSSQLLVAFSVPDK